MKRTIGYLAGLLIAFLLVSGCQKQADLVGPQSEPQSNPGVIGKISLPQGVTIKSALLSIYQRYDDPGQTVNVHRITAPWAEATVTWNSFGNQYDPAVVASFTTGPVGYRSVEIKSLVQKWVDGVYPDYGVLLEQVGTSFTNYWSSEASLDRPKLVIIYDEGGLEKTVTIQRGAFGDVNDTHIWQPQPNRNYGSDSILYTGLVGGFEVYELIDFDVTITPEVHGCTRSYGYWKTHSTFGPARYDGTWAKLTPLAENSPFFLSGKSYYQVLWTNPSGGNAYYILAHAYIAARLNTLHGASIPAPVLDAWNQATVLLKTYTPAQVGAWRGNRGQRLLFIGLAGILNDYDNGLSGPGPCSDNAKERMALD